MTDDAPDRPLIAVSFPAPAPDGTPLDGVALVTLDRPNARNALSFALLAELDAALAVLDDDEACRAIVITGAGDRAFAAGADIRELAGASRHGLHADDPFAAVDRVGRLRTPVIAAVRGYALGGGAELAMACDMLIAADDAVFGQPEISIGVIPGAGGTQRLARAVGRARAMELVLTGRRFGAAEAERLGLVTVLVPADEVLPRALVIAAEIAAKPVHAVRAAKAAVNATQALPLDEGLRFERDRFEELFDTEDRDEGMLAFLEKRPPAWRHR
ncbi:MAG TPA: enoyl-CoA hydratase-related protein [Candidatus Limnocylindrales bacterium]|nr:enoyl-CoA hydratase-related protein [Candidatus Limnocylindrales bacterium]